MFVENQNGLNDSGGAEIDFVIEVKSGNTEIQENSKIPII